MTVDGVILAGGSARRFGSNKCLYPVEGVPMIARVAACMRPIVSRLLLSVAEEGGVTGFEGLIDVFDEVVFDDVPDGGPLGGMWSAAKTSTADWMMVAACDLPWIEPESMELLRDAAVSRDAAVAVDSTGRLQPLCGCYSLVALKTIPDRAAAGMLSAVGFAESLAGMVHVALPDGQLINVNAREDVAWHDFMEETTRKKPLR